MKLLRYTPEPEKAIAMAAKLCYSAADIDELAQDIEEKDQANFLQKLMDMGHLSRWNTPALSLAWRVCLEVYWHKSPGTVSQVLA